MYYACTVATRDRVIYMMLERALCAWACAVHEPVAKVALGPVAECSSGPVAVVALEPVAECASGPVAEVAPISF